MLFEEAYYSGFKSNPEKEGVSFLTSLSNGNGNSHILLKYNIVGPICMSNTMQ